MAVGIVSDTSNSLLRVCSDTAVLACDIELPVGASVFQKQDTARVHHVIERQSLEMGFQLPSPSLM